MGSSTFSNDLLANLARGTAAWSLQALSDLAETATSRLWRADGPDYGPVVLKILKPYGADEIHGVHLMAALQGQGMVRLHAQDGPAILMEFVEGESLGGLVRRGEDWAAAEHLAAVATQVRRANPANLVPLRRQLSALLNSPDFPAERALAEQLLDTTTTPVALHGDLHHDNILLSKRGWLAIDAKGLVGEAGFEFANAFRNPFDCQALARRPDRMLALAALFAQSCGQTPARVLDWARVLVAISMLWDRAAHRPTADDEVLLPLLSSARGLL